MQCYEVQELLSAYHDGELSEDVQGVVNDHIEECPQCADELSAFQSMSSGLQHLDSPPVVSQLQTTECSVQSGDSTDLLPTWIRVTARLAAAVLISLVLLGGGYLFWQSHPSKGYESMSLEEYVTRFQTDPDAAQQFLVSRYNGRKVSVTTAERELGYRPIVLDKLPPDYQLESIYLLDMPCCRCPQSLLKTKSGNTLCVFEYEDEQPAQFGEGHACICADCQGTCACLVQMQNRLAATWKVNDRYITIVGLTDLDEVNSLIRHWNGREMNF